MMSTKDRVRQGRDGQRLVTALESSDTAQSGRKRKKSNDGKSDGIQTTPFAGMNNGIFGTAQSISGIVVDEVSMRLIDAEVQQNGILFHIVNKIFRKVFAGGIQFRVKINNRNLSISPETEKYINDYWIPEMEQMLMNIYKYGFTPVVYVSYRKKDGTIVTIPSVPADGTFTVRFLLDEAGKPHYFLYRNQRVNSLMINTSALRNKIKADKEPGTMGMDLFERFKSGEPALWENSFVFVVRKFEPTVDGKLNSLVSKTMPYVTAYNQLWKNYNDATNEMARPPYVHTRQAGKTLQNNIPGPADIPLGESDAALNAAQDLRQLNDIQRAELNRAISLSAATNAGQSVVDYDPTTQRKVNKNITNPWQTRKYDLPDGIGLQPSVPVAQIPNSFPQASADLIKNISNILEVSADVGSGSSQKYATNAEFAQRHFHDLIEWVQNMLKPLGERLFTEVYSEDHLEVIEEMVETMEEADERMINDDELQNLVGSIDVTMAFNSVPDVTLDVLKKLFDDDLITHEEYRSQALRLFGICEEDCQGGKFASELRMDMQEQDMKMKEKYQAKEKAGGAGAKPSGSGGAASSKTASDTKSGASSSGGGGQQKKKVQASAAVFGAEEDQGEHECEMGIVDVSDTATSSNDDL